MNKIVFPLKRTMTGQTVADLQDALLFLLARAIISRNDDQSRAAAMARVARERESQFFDSATADTVALFQAENGVTRSGEVDEQTAEILNRTLLKLGILYPDAKQAFRLVTGKVTRDDTRPFAGARVRATNAIQQPPGGEIRLGDDIADSQGNYTIRYEPIPGSETVFLKVSVMTEEGRILSESAVVKSVQPLESIDVVVPNNPISARRTLAGTVLLQHGLPAEKIALRLYRNDFGGKQTKLAETTTNSDGRFAFLYTSENRVATVEVRAVTTAADEIRLSKPLNDFTDEVRDDLTLIAPSSMQPLAAEYRRLSASLTQLIGNMASLIDAREDAERQDLTILSGQTDWDARLIALATLSEKLGAAPDVGLSSEAIYGLLRAGLPSDKMLLAHVDPDVVEMAAKKVRNAGIIDIDENGIADLKKKFTIFANATRLAMPAMGSRSTYGQLLDASGAFSSDDTGMTLKNKFASVFLQHQGNSTQLWDQAKTAGLDEKQITRLKLHGKIAFLAGNSEGMTTRIMGKDLQDPSELVDHDLHTADAWKAEIFEQAGIPRVRRGLVLTKEELDRIDALIPTIYKAEKVEDRLDAYAEDMARKVRLSYPTHVLTRLLVTDERFKPLSGNDGTAKLLKNAIAQGFRLGETPISSFLKSTTGLSDGLSEPEFGIACEQMKLIQRVYQITPNNEAMPVLLSLGLTSALDVTACTHEQFVELFNTRYLEIYKSPAPTGSGSLIYNKSNQVSSVTYNLFAIAKKLDSEPPVAGISASPQVRESVKNELIKHFPTMESLFGSMDYCECEHCRSVLSPAAYLVDLLQFVDTEPAVWSNYLADWKETHGGQEYPYKNANGDALKPYDVLIERRPDLPHIALTCENTHTALPYIDIVNEILEYYVANGKLAKEAARDTGGATTAELLAEPQNVIREAYDTLCGARYPLNLPFDLWLETIRKFCEYFETPFYQVLEVLRPDEDVFASIQTPTNVGNATVNVRNADAAQLRVGMSCTYLAASTTKMSRESKRIATVGAADSAGAGQTTITFDGAWLSPPVDGDRLVSQPLDRRANIFMESLGLVPAEVDIFSDPKPLADDKWHGLYGFPSARVSIQSATNASDVTVSVTNADARELKVGLAYTYFDQSANAFSQESKTIVSIGTSNSDGPGRTAVRLEVPWTTAPSTGDLLVCDAAAMLRSAKALSRRLGVTYKEITEIIQTGFVNPDFSKLRLLFNLDISVRDAKFYKDEQAFYAAHRTFYETSAGKALTELPIADRMKFNELTRKLAGRELTGWDVLHTVASVERRLEELAKAPDLAPNWTLDRLRTELLDIPFDRVLVLADPDTGCNFDQTILRYADGTQADAIVFLRINLFVRLWRKLGWTIEETDRALTTFVPQSAPFDGSADNLAKQPLSTALIYLAHLKVLDEKLKVGKQSRLKLLALWSDLPTTGKNPLYGQLFLNRSVLKSSAVFDHPLGQYLSDTSIKLKAHLLAVQGALGLTADECRRILEDNGKSLDSCELSLATVSLLYRYSLLAKALKLPVSDLITLKQLSGLNPFSPLIPAPLLTLDQDHPFVQTLEFVKVVEEIKASGLTIEDLDYLLRHRFDDTGKYRPNSGATLALLKSLSEGVRAIRSEHAVPDEPSALSEDILRQKLGLALAPDVVERFLKMVATTVEFTATKGGVNPADKFDPEIFAAEERIRQVSYKEVPREEQTLTVRGVLVDPEKKMQTTFDAVLTASQKQTFADLLDSVERQAHEFFDKQLKKQTLRFDVEAGFLDDADFPQLFAPLDRPIPILSTDTQAQIDSKRAGNEEIERKNLDELQKRRYRIAQAFLPVLQKRLVRQFLIQSMTAHINADPVLLESLISDKRLLAVPGAMINSFAATAEQGLNATFWASADGTGAPLSPISLDDADTGAKDGAGNPLKPAGADSARLDAYVEVPVPGAYRFYVQLDKQNAQAELRFPHLPEPVLVQGTAGTDHVKLRDQPNGYLELKAGVLYRLSLELTHLNGGDARLLMQGETTPLGPLSQLKLYPAAAIEAAEKATTLLSKAVQIVQSLGISEREIRYLLTHAGDFDGMSLSDLPTATVGDSPAEKANTAKRFGHVRRLAAYARLKRDLAGGSDDLIGIFESNGTAAADRLDKHIYPLIARLTRRDVATVKAIAETIVKTPNVPAFESERPLWKLWEALQAVERFGILPEGLRNWAEMVDSATTGARRFQLTRDAKEAIKARFEPEIWRRVAQPIFDKLRTLQRDAIVSHVMHQHGFQRMEELYEFFLIDPGMEPVVQTSRIRLAISSLQLFIQRVLLNLEEKVHPSTINSKQWEWMKRFRVWEANRKIFLFPENWLEPEFRDDKTHLFTELEGALLQGDVSSDLVEDAFFNYLKKLDELARLDICAMHMEDNVDPALRVLHVFGRTYSNPRKYFYRRYALQMWTPWEPVSAEIEGDHLAPVVWRDRLYLFWVTFADQADPNPPTGTATDSPPTGTATGSKKLTEVTLTEVMTDLKAVVAHKKVDVQLHWSVYMNGEWSTRESSDFSGVITKTMPTSFDRNSVFVHVSKELRQGNELGVYIHLGGSINDAFYLAGRNSAPESKTNETKPDNPFSANAVMANRYSGTAELRVSFIEKITTDASNPKPTDKALISSSLPASKYTLLPCNNILTAHGVPKDAYSGAANPKAVEAALEKSQGEIATLMKPVFYQDSLHTFFIEPDVTERTIEKWEDYIPKSQIPKQGLGKLDRWEKINVIPEFPKKWRRPLADAPWSSPIHTESLVNQVTERDWLINPGSVLKFGDVLVGPTGKPGIEIRDSADPATRQQTLNVSPGADIARGQNIVLTEADSLARSGLVERSSGLNVVGSAGFNSAIEWDLKSQIRYGADKGPSGIGRTLRQ